MSIYGHIESDRTVQRRDSTHGSGLGGGVDELVAEDLPVTLGGGVLDDDLGVLVVQLVDDVLVLLVELELVVGSNALLGGGSTGKWGGLR